MCSILQVSKEFPTMVWLSLLLLMSLSHSTVGWPGNEVIYISCVFKLVLIHCVTALKILLLFFAYFFPLNVKLKISACCSSKM